jgi:hypothetical protein
MFWRNKQVGQRIAVVAAEYEDSESFSRLAREQAAQVDGSFIRKSKAWLFGSPTKPPELEGRFTGLGEWMWACQVAIFEIWYHLGAPALPQLRKVAFGVYDWTQAHATNVLCRLALDGLEAEATAAAIAQALPGWRYEQIMRVCPRVAELAARSEPLQQAYEALIEDYLQDDPIDCYELIAAYAPHAPPRVLARYGDFLRGLVEGQGLEGRSAFDDGHVVQLGEGERIRAVAKSGPTYPTIDDFHRIRAALLLRILAPDDARNLQHLEQWASGHPDESVRAELSGTLAEEPRF